MKAIGRLVALLMLIALLLSACGGAAPQGSGAAPTAAPAAPAAERPTAAAAPPAEATAAPAAPAASGGQKVKITWWTENAEEPLQQALKSDFVETFNAAHPDIELEIAFKDKLDEVLRTAIQGGAAPDIIQTPGPAFVAEYVAAGHILDLDQYAAKYGWKDKIFPWALDVGKLDGKIYSLPLTYETMVLWYNKKVFAENGWQPPKTRDELEKIAEDAKAKGMYPFVNGNAGWKGVNEWLLTVFYSNYAGADNVYQALTQKKKWDDPLFVDSVKLLNDYMQKGYFRGSKENYYATDFPDIGADLASGKGAINFEGTWAFQGRPNEFKDNPDDWDWAPNPVLRNGITPVFDMGIGSTISINAKSEHPDAAAEVLNWVFNDPKRAAKIIHDFPGEWVVPISLSKSDFPPDTDARFIRALETIADASRKGSYGYTTWTFWPAKSDQYIIEKLESVFNKQMTPEEFSKGLEQLYEQEAKDGKLPPVPPRQ
jgi:raffinose/stachyose/melibiose transport system substrate-binding protein